MALSPEEVAALPRSRRAMRHVERGIQTRFLVFLLLVAIYLFIEEKVKIGPDGYIDWLYISTIAFFALGLALAVRLPTRMERAIIRLAARGSLSLPEEETPAFLLAFEHRAARWALIGGILGAAAVLGANFFTGSPWSVSSPLQAMINLSAVTIETCVGFFIGYYAGYAASNGSLGRFLKQRGVTLHAQPGHLDGVAGFRPVGAFYFSQAAILGLAALFLIVWWVLIGLSPYLARHNEAWRTPYLVFFFVVLLAEMLAFALPLWSFHLELEAQRRDLLLLADKLSQRIAAQQTHLVMNPSSEHARELKEQQVALTDYYWAIQRMPTWPISTGVWWRLLLSTLGLLLPLAAQLAIERLPVFAFLR
jgi:hypothetical protein